MKYLALDLGTSTGWATSQYIGGMRTINSGVQVFKPSRFEGGGMRYLRMQQWLLELHLLIGGFELVAFEEVRRHAGVGAAHVYGGFLATVTGFCEAQRIPYLGVPVGTIKKHATGKGNAGKDLMVQVATDRGHHPADDNEADALAILYWMFDEAARTTDQRPASDGPARRRVPLAPF